MSLETFESHFNLQDIANLPLDELKSRTSALLKEEASSLHNELEELIEQKEKNA